MKYKHLFFDLDQTLAPSRQPILPEMYELLDSIQEDIVIVTGQGLETLAWQSDNLPAYTLGQCGNYATDIENNEMWSENLSQSQRDEIMNHIEQLTSLLDHTPNADWKPVEDRGGLVCFSPVGNIAPTEVKSTYDPDSKKREALLEKIPFESDELIVKIGGSTSFDYTQKDAHKGTNVKRLIDHMGWDKDECVFFGDRLYPGGNDEPVIGVIDTIAVEDHLDCFSKLQSLLDIK